MNSKPILCVDFDGVIHSYNSGWKGACNIPDPPVPGALRWLWKATEWWDVNIYSSRSKEDGAIDAMKEWLFRSAMDEWRDSAFVRNHFLAAISFPTQKPAANMTIDDRAFCFEGDWSEIDPCALLDFKPWNKRPPVPALGATGEFPQGQLNDHDEGALRMAVGYDKIDGIVRIDFGKPVAWLGLPPPEAIQLARLLLRHAGAKKVEISL